LQGRVHHHCVHALFVCADESFSSASRQRDRIARTNATGETLDVT